jgi:hypothetical protein
MSSQLHEAQRRYETDPEFHRIVVMLEKFYEDQLATPSDLRSAAMLAAWNVETRIMRPFVYGGSKQ